MEKTSQSALENNLKTYETETTQAAEERDADGTTGFSRRLKALLDGRGYLLVITDAQSDYRRHRSAKEFLESPAGEAWLRACQR